jgi:hypothetical protein
MKGYHAIVVGSILILICGCIGSGDTFDKDGALEFSLKVVETYFDNDMGQFLSYLADEVYTLEGEGPSSKKEVENAFSEKEYVADESYANWTMEEYMNIYEPRVMDFDEIRDEFPESESEIKDLGWKFDDDDYLFIGFETKNGDEGPLWDDPLIFAVTHESGEWKFKAFSG